MTLEKRVKHGHLRGIAKAMKTAFICSVLGWSVAFVGSTLKYHNNQIETTQTEKMVEYAHPDKQTTHILNYISGKEAISKEERKNLLVDYIDSWCQQNDQNAPELNEKNEKEIIIWMINNTTLLSNKNSVDEHITGINKFIPLKREWNQNLYNSLWELETEVGAPYLRWTMDKKVTYSSRFNTAEIAPYAPLETLLAELSHSKQFNDDSLDYDIKALEAAVRISTKMISSHSFDGALEEEYEIPGSLEYEAHQVIEPQLEQKIEK